MKDKRKVIIDTDPGIDDALALILANASEDLEILGITIAAGNVDSENCAKNALDILHLMGDDKTPVYYGSKKPLTREASDARETHGSNGIGNYKLEDSGRVALKGAVDFIADTLRNNDDVSIISIGPLTNIANLIKKYPEEAKKINELVMMGGNYQAPGNCSPVAEFNVWYDPESAKMVFDQLNRPITMVGLDVTRKVLLTPNYTELIKKFDNKISDAITGMVQFYHDFHWNEEEVLGSVINDPLAVAQFIDPTLCSGIDAYVEVITDGPASGMTMVDAYNKLGKEPNCKVLTEVDHKRFFKYFLNTIFPEKKEITEKIIDNDTYGI